MLRFLPILHWLTRYKKGDLPRDIIAGLTVGIVIVPQGLAYAMLAGLPPQFGLYAALIPLLAYMVLGTSKQLAIGPVALDSLLVAIGLGAIAGLEADQYIAAAIALALMVGVIQILLGLLRMGYLVNFLSKPVISGFISAAAVIIIFSQLQNLTGITSEAGGKFHLQFLNTFKALPAANLYDLTVGLLAIFLLLAIKKISPKIPGILITVVLGILAVFAFDLDSHGIKVVGDIPKGLPSFELPAMNMELLQNLWPIALTLALLGYLEAISIAKGLGEKTDDDTLDSNQELLALGFANLSGSFFQSYPVTGGFSRSAINHESGVKTNLAALFAVFMVSITLLFLTSLFYFLPKAILAAIIIVAVFRLIDLSYARELWNHRKDEFAVLLLTFVLTLLWGLTQGILIGILFSLLLMVYRSSKPHFAVLGNIKGSDYYKNVNRFDDRVAVREDLLIVRFDAQLYFGNANYFRKQLLRFIEKKGGNLKGVILNAEAINYIDATAAQMLTKVIRELHLKELKFFIAGAIGPARDIIFSSGIIQELGQEHLFVETKEAVAYFDDPASVSIIGSKLAYQNKGKRN